MFWNLGLSSSSTLESLLNRLAPSTNGNVSSASASVSSPSEGGGFEAAQAQYGEGQSTAGSRVSIEELLDEQDLLSELKGQNARLIQLLASPSSIASLLHWAAYGMEDIERRELEREAIARAELARLRAAKEKAAENQGSVDTAGDGPASETSPRISEESTERLGAGAESPGKGTEVESIGAMGPNSAGVKLAVAQPDQASEEANERSNQTETSSTTPSRNDIFHTTPSKEDLVPPPSYVPRPPTPSSFIQPRDIELERKRNYRYPQIATEILCSDVWSITEGLLNALDGPMKDYWEDVLGPLETSELKVGYDTLNPVGGGPAATSPASSTSSERDRLREAAGREKAYIRYLVEREHAADELFEEDEKRRELLLGNWARIMGLLMAKKPNEVVEFMKTIDGPIERLIRKIDSPPVQDVLLRLVASEEQGVVGIIELLWSQQLIPRLLDLLAPSYPETTHATVSELMKSIIALCAPATFNPNGGDPAAQAAQAQQVLSSPLPGSDPSSPTESRGEGQQHPQQQQEQDLPPRPPAPRNNIMVRELVGARSVITLVGYMISAGPTADASLFGTTEEAQEDASLESFVYHFDPFTTTPLPSIASQSSSLVHSAIIMIELIRKNNPDFSEPSLFHTMRNRLMSIQSKQSKDRANARVEAIPHESSEERASPAAEPSDADEAQDREALESAMQEMSEKMGIVHLGFLLEVLTEQLPTFQELVRNPRSQPGLRTPGCLEPLTHERLRIVEMYAELLHCSNMALLNRRHGAGPSYSAAGCLEGGLEGLETLGRALEGDVTVGQSGDEDRGDDLQPAKELPVSQCGSLDRSVPASEDGRHDQETVEETHVEKSADLDDRLDTPDLLSPKERADLAGNKSAPAVPPPPSQEDEARLRDVMIQDPRIRSLSHANQAVPSETASASNVAAASAMSVVGSEATPIVLEELEQQSTYTDTEPEISGGETLKHKFIEQRVLPTIVNLFFEYPNNNFLHNVAYDVVQQVLNGRLGPGLNQELIIVLFREAKIVERLLDAQRLTTAILQTKGTSRPAFMGHMMLMAEEIGKFFARCTPELLTDIQDSFVPSEWAAFVEGPLTDTRLRDTRLLGGTRPQDTMRHPDDGAKTDTDSSDDDDDDTAQAFAGQPLTRAASNGSAFTSKFGFGTADTHEGSGRSTSSDEDSDDSGSPQLRPRYDQHSGHGQRDSLEDVFSPSNGNAQHIDDDDEAWGDFERPSDSPADDPFGDPFEPPTAPFGSAASNRPFTSIDFAERAFADDAVNWNGLDDDSPGIDLPASEVDSLDNAAAFLAANWSVPGSSVQEGEDLQGEDMPPAEQGASATAPVGISIPHRRPRSVSISSSGSPTEQRFNHSRSSSLSNSSPETHRKLHPAAALGNNPANQAISPPDPSLVNAASWEEPLGHGVTADTQLRGDGMLVRRLEGEDIVVPADETILSVSHARKMSLG